MNTTRLLCASSLVLGLAAVACTDSPAPTPPSAPLATQAGQPEAAGSAQALNVGSRREVPAQYRWVGEEHNRLLGLIEKDVREAGTRGLVHRGDPSQDCRWMWDRVRREVPETARRGGFAGHEREVTDIAEPAVMRLDVCQRLAGVSLPSAPSGTQGRPNGEARVEITDAAFSVIETVRNRIRSASSMADIDEAIGDAASAATSLKGADAEAVYAALSVARGSADYWARSIPAAQRWSLFRGPWSELTEFVGADFGSCGAVLSFMRLFSAAMPMNLKVGVCAISAAVGSGMQAFE